MVEIKYKKSDGTKVGTETVARGKIPSVGDKRNFGGTNYTVTSIGKEVPKGKLTVYVK